MLYIASLPGFFIAFGMQFAVESPRWLSKVGLYVFERGQNFISSFFRGSICCSRPGDWMKQELLSATYGEDLKWKEQLKSSSP